MKYLTLLVLGSTLFAAFTIHQFNEMDILRTNIHSNEAAIVQIELAQAARISCIETYNTVQAIDECMVLNSK